MVTAFERFQDALDRRASQLKRDGYEYKAGFYESFLEGLAANDPKIAGQLIAAAQMLEKWANAEENRQDNERDMVKYYLAVDTLG